MATSLTLNRQFLYSSNNVFCDVTPCTVVEIYEQFGGLNVSILGELFHIEIQTNRFLQNNNSFTRRDYIRLQELHS